MLFIGIDLGTSACKLLLSDEKGTVLNTVSIEYPLILPKSGWSEQDPACWWQACLSGIPDLLQGYDPGDVCGIGAGGQMHGLVILDENDAVLRPAILWNDSRTDHEVEYLNGEIGKKTLSQRTANIAFAGFTAPKLLWVKKNEPEIFSRIKKIMLPKDYIVYMLTGVHSCDYSDASGMLLLDVKNKCWSKEMLSLCSVSEEQMPRLFESYEKVGTVKKELCDIFGFNSVTVCAGAGDNAAAAVGTGTVGEGKCNLSLGTSGTVFISSDSFGVDPTNALHSFAHADGYYHLMGCMLSAASCNKWWQNGIIGTSNYKDEEAAITDDMLGKNSVFFLPYLMGERSPINDTDARGAFVGMSMKTGRAEMLQAILEGVAFAIRDSFQVARELGIDIKRTNICGGGSKSPLWKKIIANVLGIPLDTIKTEEGPGYGGAILAMVACGVYPNVRSAADALVSVESTVEPDPQLTKLYEEKYQQFKKIYPSMKQLFKDLK